MRLRTFRKKNGKLKKLFLEKNRLKSKIEKTYQNVSKGASKDSSLYTDFRKIDFAGIRYLFNQLKTKNWFLC